MLFSAHFVIQKEATLTKYYKLLFLSSLIIALFELDTNLVRIINEKNHLIKSVYLKKAD